MIDPLLDLVINEMIRRGLATEDESGVTFTAYGDELFQQISKIKLEIESGRRGEPLQ